MINVILLTRHHFFLYMCGITAADIKIYFTAVTVLLTKYNFELMENDIPALHLSVIEIS